MFLIVGLGNPGATYESTRHNIGFMFLDSLTSEIAGASFTPRFHSLALKCRWEGHDLLFLKPQTFMNLSGGPVSEAAKFLKVPAERIIAIFDDLDQAPGAVRMRFGGGHGGHNGVRDMIAKLGDDKFYRIKIGIGKPEFKSATADWVLSKYGNGERAALSTSFQAARERLLAILSQESAKK